MDDRGLHDIHILRTSVSERGLLNKCAKKIMYIIFQYFMFKSAGKIAIKFTRPPAGPALSATEREEVGHFIV